MRGGNPISLEMGSSMKHSPSDDDGSVISFTSVSSGSVLSKFTLNNLHLTTPATKSKKHAILSLKQDGLALSAMPLQLQNTKPFVLTAVRQNGMALEYASPKLQDTKSVVKVAVKQNGMALQFASEVLQNDSSVVLSAMRQNGRALQYASSRLTNDKDVVLAAVRSNGMALQYASPDMQNDSEVVTAATLRDCRAVKFLGSEYTSGKKKLVVSCRNSDAEVLDVGGATDVEALADEIVKRVMTNASKEFSVDGEGREEKCVDERKEGGGEERDEREDSEAVTDKAVESCSAKEVHAGSFSFFESISKFFTKKTKKEDEKTQVSQEEHAEVPGADAKEPVAQVTPEAKEHVQANTELKATGPEQVKVEPPQQSTQKADSQTTQEKSFTVFESIGKYIDSTCEAGCTVGQRLCQPHRAQKVEEKSMAGLSYGTNDIIASEMEPVKVENVEKKEVEKKEVCGGGAKVENAAISSFEKVDESNIADGVVIVLKKKKGDP